MSCVAIMRDRNSEIKSSIRSNRAPTKRTVESECITLGDYVIYFSCQMEIVRRSAFGAQRSAFGGLGRSSAWRCKDGKARRLRASERLCLRKRVRRDALLTGGEESEMLCAFEPAALDQSLDQLRELNSSLTGSAVLTLP